MPSTFRFSDMIEDFEPNEVLGRLTGSEEGFHGEKDILFIAFLTWVYFPKRAAVRRSMVIRTGQIIHGLEKKFARRFGKSDRLAGDRRLRNDPRYQGLFIEAYYPIGGLQAAIRNQSQMSFTLRRSARLSEAMDVYRLMAIMHYHVATFGTHQPHFGLPSLHKAIRAYMALYGGDGRKSPKSRTLQERWSAVRPSLPFLYSGLAALEAPHRVPPPPLKPANEDTEALEDDTPLIKDLYRSWPAFQPKAPLFERFVSRARFVQEEILAANPRIHDGGSSFQFPPTVRKEPIPPPEFNETEAETLRKSFLDARFSTGGATAN